MPPSKLSAHAAAMRDTAHQSIGIVEPLRSSPSSAASPWSSVISHTVHPWARINKVGLILRWSRCGACGGGCFLVACLSAVVKDVFNDEIPRGCISQARVAMGEPPGSDGAARHESTPVKLAQLSYHCSGKIQLLIVNKIENNRPVSNYRRYSFILKRKQ